MTVRPAFKPAEMERLLDHLRENMDDPKAVRYRYPRRMLYYYVGMMVTSGMRPNDALFLRWSDIEIQTREDGKRVALLTLRGKGFTRESFTTPEFIPFLDRLREIARHTQPGDLVFTRPDGQGAWRFAPGFRQAVEECGLTLDTFRRVRTIYSLRHTYAMNRLSQPDARYDLISENMGTSVAMLNKHYGSHIEIRKWMEEVTC
jgi:integrase